MMTREEAILLSAYTGFLLVPDFSQVHKFCEDTLGRPIWTHEFADSDVQKEIREKLFPQIMDLIQNPTALRGPTRAMVERMRGEWQFDAAEPNGKFGGIRCSKCHKAVSFGDENAFHNAKVFERYCSACGAPMTDEAVDMVMERWKEAVNDD